jgi:uncharacterized protein with PIN domain
MFTKRSSRYYKCSRCNLIWSKEAFFRLGLKEQKRFLSGDGCPICYHENWKNGHYLGTKEEIGRMA